MFGIQDLSAVVSRGFSWRCGEILFLVFMVKFCKYVTWGLTDTCDVWFDPYSGVHSCVSELIFLRLVDERDAGRWGLFCRWSR